MAVDVFKVALPGELVEAVNAMVNKGDGYRVVVGRELGVRHRGFARRDAMQAVEEEAAFGVGDVVDLDVSHKRFGGGFGVDDDGVVEEVVSARVAEPADDVANGRQPLHVQTVQVAS